MMIYAKVASGSCLRIVGHVSAGTQHERPNFSSRLAVIKNPKIWTHSNKERREVIRSTLELSTN